MTGAIPMPVNKDLRDFLELLNSNAVDYLVVGALAVTFHGFPPYTADLDLLVRPAAENAQRPFGGLETCAKIFKYPAG